jgi:hypothetical protein
MKICPTCRKTYPDDGLNFCLDDGSVLTLAGPEPPATVMMHAPPPTSPSVNTAPGAGAFQTSWDRQQPNYTMQPKKSRTWLWVVGIFGILLLLCGGGFAVFLGFAIYNADNTNDNGRVSTNNKNTRPSPSPKDVPDDRTSVQKIDLSGWVQPNSLYGNTEFTGGELLMSSKQKGFYYVLVAQRDYTTENATTSVKVRNVDNADSSMGYGLVFHSDPQPLQQGYAFLIDTKKKRYRIVRHIPKDEPVVVKWTNSTAIKDGSQENILEARDANGSVDLYINGEKVTTIRNTYGSKPGVPGIYSGDGAKAAFSNLEIRK